MLKQVGNTHHHIINYYICIFPVTCIHTQFHMYDVGRCKSGPSFQTYPRSGIRRDNGMGPPPALRSERKQQKTSSTTKVQ